MSDQTPAPNAAGVTPASPADPNPTPSIDHSARIAELEKKLADYQVRDGRARNEKGYYERRIKELEQLALSNSTPQPELGNGTDYSTVPQYQPQPQYNQPGPDIVTRDEFDLYRFQRDHTDRFEAVRAVALDGNRVGNFIRYRVDAWGRPMIGPDGRAVGDIYATYSAIADHLEKEELKQKVAQTQPNRNPVHATISGSGAGTFQPTQDDEAFLNDPNTTPEMIRERFPEQFTQDPGSAKSWLRG